MLKLLLLWSLVTIAECYGTLPSSRERKSELDFGRPSRARRYGQVSEGGEMASHLRCFFFSPADALVSIYSKEWSSNGRAVLFYGCVHVNTSKYERHSCNTPLTVLTEHQHVGLALLRTPTQIPCGLDQKY